MVATVPYTFSNTPNGQPIPLGQLDANFAYLTNAINGPLTITPSMLSPLGPLWDGTGKLTSQGDLVTGSGDITCALNPSTSVALGLNGFLFNVLGNTPLNIGSTGISVNNTLTLAQDVGGSVIITPPNACANTMFKFPPDMGGSGYVLGTDGAGNTSWISPTSFGVLSFSGGTTGLTPVQPAEGNVVLGGTLNVPNGGTGLSTLPANGQLLIGNGTSYTLATLSGSSPISITNGSGSSTIGLNGAVPYENGGTGLTATPEKGQIPIGTGSGYELSTITPSDSISVTNGVGTITLDLTDGAPSWDTDGNVNVIGNLDVGGDVDITGTVGIGTAPANYGLTINMGTSIYEAINATATSSSAINGYSPNGGLYGDNDSGIYGLVGTTISSVNYSFYGNSNMYVAGNVGIGTATPLNTLQVVGTTYLQGNVGINTAPTNYGLTIDMGSAIYEAINATCASSSAINGYSPNGGLFGEDTNSGIYGLVGATGQSFIGNGPSSCTAWNTTSDSRLKENVVNISGGLSIIQQLRAVSFDWKANSFAGINNGGSKSDFGLIAQEVELVVPEVVSDITVRSSKDSSPSIEESLGSVKGVEYSRLVPFLIAAVQELKSDHDALKADYDAYKLAHP